MTKKTELVRCHYCLLSWEGLETDDCPRCHEHFLEVLATYPVIEEKKIGTEIAYEENSR